MQRHPRDPVAKTSKTKRTRRPQKSWTLMFVQRRL